MIYIGKFLHTTNQQEKNESRRRHGEFNLLVSAEDKKAAVEKFRDRIAEAQKSTDLFEGDSQIYLVHILEMQRLPKDRAQLFNFQSVVGDPDMPTISCQAPSADNDGCRIVDWQKNRPGVDGQAAIPFMTFSAGSSR
ncbi:MAG: hypothetical protein MUC33_07340 [Desulfobacterales bacterium]|jgi:hypothetical protein|nr:hypothetical protein [Desulfobacterales bacterium]